MEFPPQFHLRSKHTLILSVLQVNNDTEAPASAWLDPDNSSNHFGPLGKIVIRNTLVWSE